MVKIIYCENSQHINLNIWSSDFYTEGMLALMLTTSLYERRRQNSKHLYCMIERRFVIMSSGTYCQFIYFRKFAIELYIIPKTNKNMLD
jgi:hypothetical protein